MTMTSERCESTWQGPSDDEGVDDLLTARCYERSGHSDLHHGLTDGVFVMWESVVGVLWRTDDGSVYRRQS